MLLMHTYAMLGADVLTDGEPWCSLTLAIKHVAHFEDALFGRDVPLSLHAAKLADKEVPPLPSLARDRRAPPPAMPQGCADQALTCAPRAETRQRSKYL